MIEVSTIAKSTGVEWLLAHKSKYYGIGNAS
jgi:hypothetical protein